MKNLINKNKLKKKIVVCKNPKRLLNKYFIYIENHEEFNMFIKVIYALPKFLWHFFYKRVLLLDFYKQLPKSNNVKQKLINFYSLMFFLLDFEEYSKAIFIIGDQLNPMNKGLLQVIERLTNIEVWIVNQGSGSMVEKINLSYSKNISRIYFPFSRESDFPKIPSKLNFLSNL